MSKKINRSKSPKIPYHRYFIFTAFIFSLYVLGRLVFALFVTQPAEINLLESRPFFSPTSTSTSTFTGSVPAPSGCSYVPVKCIQAPCADQLVCPPASATPRPPSPSPSSTAYPTPVSTAAPASPVASGVLNTPVPVTANKVASFTASGACGTQNFLAISFTCKDGRSKVISTDTCTDIIPAMDAAINSCNQ